MSKLTKWEIGQGLIHISDEIGGVVDDLIEAEETELAKSLTEIMAKVGDLFNQNNDHSFGILDSNSINKHEGRG